MNTHIKVSASDLVKQSAMQTSYFYHRQLKRTPSAQMIRGVEHQKKITISEYKEMRGTVEWDNKFLVFFSIDEVIPDILNKTVVFKEHKNTEGEIPDWYIHSSIIQSAFYHSLALHVDYLITAKFFRKEHDTKTLQLNGITISSILQFANELKFEVRPNDPEFIINYYKRKCHTIEDYTLAKNWDIEYKFKDWEQLHKAITYSNI